MKNQQLTDAQRQVIAELIGRVLGQVGYYKLMRKLGAPRYAAYFAANVIAFLRDMSDPIKPRVDKAFKQ